jgi:hypothetical protein
VISLAPIPFEVSLKLWQLQISVMDAPHELGYAPFLGLKSTHLSTTPFKKGYQLANSIAFSLSDWFSA